MSSTNNKRGKQSGAWFVLEEDEKCGIAEAVAFACALRAVQGKPVEFEHRKAATNAAVGGYVNAVKHIDKMNKRAREQESRRLREQDTLIAY